MEKKKYIPSEEHLASLELLKEAIKKDLKFAYALHSSLLAKRMRTWGHQALKYLPKKSDNMEWHWMKDYPCGDYDELLHRTIQIHYPEIYEGIREGIPLNYIQNFISENLYPFSLGEYLEN